ncbi:hypothetical protein CEXT_718581 [Caerostris extrusa]|uniref:Uncharacterized protein n=1 Tax=Caerostris extrusa TaxID=172846 RepID=A0AAV4US68_CAEEX|nr:hypothetical protein CEXT_718581 [Caerostris extrusa]
MRPPKKDGTLSNEHRVSFLSLVGLQSTGNVTRLCKDDPKTLHGLHEIEELFLLEKLKEKLQFFSYHQLTPAHNSLPPYAPSLYLALVSSGDENPGKYLPSIGHYTKWKTRVRTLMRYYRSLSLFSFLYRFGSSPLGGGQKPYKMLSTSWEL